MWTRVGQANCCSGSSATPPAHLRSLPTAPAEAAAAGTQPKQRTVHKGIAQPARATSPLSRVGRSGPILCRREDDRNMPPSLA
eukprot:2736484-Pyramimonas_sp.AAC.1